MLIDNSVLYTSELMFEAGIRNQDFYYKFDYDERSSSNNPDLQHFHTFYEMAVFLDKKASYMINGNLYETQCCDIVLIPPMVLHKTLYPEGEPCKRLVIYFSLSDTLPPELEENMAPIYELFNTECPIYRFKGQNKRNVMKALNDIHQLILSPNEFTKILIHNKLIEFLSTVYMYKDYNTYSNDVELEGITDKIYNITAYISKNYQEPLSLNFISKKFFISNYYLSHKFKDIIGLSLTNYIQMTRITNSQSLLLTTDNSITSIAIQCGFSSFSQFNRVFNKFVHMSPSAFRKNANDTFWLYENNIMASLPLTVE